MGCPWKRESLILRLPLVFSSSFFCFNGVPLEKGVLDFEIAFCFFFQFFVLMGYPWKRESLILRLPLVFSSSFFVLMGYPWKREA